MNRSSKFIKFISALIVIIALVNIWAAPPTAQANNDKELIQAFVLLSPTQNNEQDLFQLQAQIEANGGHVTHTVPYQAIIANIPVDTLPYLSNLPFVSTIITRPTELSMATYGSDARRSAGIWNSLVTPPPAEADLRFVI